jgi:multiple sugar transport system ATP-binding protein
MSNVFVQGLSKSFKDVDALQDVSFDIQHGEFFVLLGHTGAGKTTLLRILAGLETQDSGTIRFDDEMMDGKPPAERDVAFVFQQYSLYPTMSVYDNLAFPLRSPMRRTSEKDIKVRVEEVAAKLRITHLLERKTAKLSGGEMQRVSIGRAIVRLPRVYLMDEPLSNLDAKLRESLRVELKHLQKVEGSTTLFVTHDQIEALTMADRIAVLDHGRQIQVGTPEDIYDRPATTFVAQLVGTPRINLVPAARDNGAIVVTDSTLTMPASVQPDLPDTFTLGVRPEDIQPGASGEFQGEVALTEPLGAETIVHIRTGKQVLLSQVSGITDLRIGDPVHFDIVRERLHFFTPQGIRV